MTFWHKFLRSYIYVRARTLPPWGYTQAGTRWICNPVRSLLYTAMWAVCSRVCSINAGVRDQLTQAAAPARGLQECSCVSGDLLPYIVSTSRQSSDSNDWVNLYKTVTILISIGMTDDSANVSKPRHTNHPLGDKSVVQWDRDRLFTFVYISLPLGWER